MNSFHRCVGVVMMTAAIAFAQARFEVASVKPSPPGAEFTSTSGGPLPRGAFNMKGGDPSRITWTNMRLVRVLMVAFDIEADRITGPGWLNSEMYDIEATMPKGTTATDFRLMLRNLLTERFNLKLHRETTEVSGYSMEVAKEGLKIRQSAVRPAPAAEESGNKPSPGGPGANPLMTVDKSGYPAPRPGNSVFTPEAGFSATIKVNDLYRATVLNEPMSEIAKFLGNAARTPVKDDTGLTGVYDFHLEYKPNLSPAITGQEPTAAADDATPGSELVDAVRKQLGLRLTRKKVPREIVVIDHVDKVPVAQ